jgi:DNA (cytosine-5)-methyltransferase 1
MNLTYIDLFAGCGGLSLGLHNAGWKGLFAIEKNPDAFQTLKFNLIDNKKHFDWPAWLPKNNLEIDRVIKNYKKELAELSGHVTMIAGGPPCQGFSTAGRRKEDDVRNGLIKSYLKFVELIKPKIIFFENVRGFTLKFQKNKSRGRVYSNYVLEQLEKLDYNVHGKLVDFSKYGVPQKRTRFILVGIQNKLLKNDLTAKSFFELLIANKKQFLLEKMLPLSPTLGNAISDLIKTNGLVDTPDRKNFQSGIYSNPRTLYQKYMRQECDFSVPNSHSFAKHKPEIEKRFKVFLKNQDSNKNISDFLKEKYDISKHTIIPLSAKHKAPTITTLPDDYIHYSEPRILTVREYARIQSFPDWFEFKGKYTTGGKERTKEVPRYTQVGNAIPPLFAEFVGIVIKDFAMDNG